MMAVDLHNHVFPAPLVDAIRDDGDHMMARLTEREGAPWIEHEQGYAYPLAAEFHDPTAKLRALDASGLDIAALSPAPPLFYYWAEAELCTAVSRQVNDAVAAYASVSERFRPLASLPMPYPEAAVAELERVVDAYGVRGVIMGTSIEGVSLADARFRPVLKRCAELGVWILAHPYYVGNKDGLQSHYLTNLIGNPYDTLLCATHLMLDGVLDELPSLNVVLAHGGGLLPYLIGRLEHGHRVRGETRADTLNSPTELMRRFYFDTILFDPKPLRYLVDAVGEGRLVLGTDAPFDMADTTPGDTVGAVTGLSEEQRRLILGAGAASCLMGERFV